MLAEDFKVGATYKITTQDRETPEGEIILGKEIVRTVLEPATKINTGFGGEEPPESVINEWQHFLRVRHPDSSKVYFLHPGTIQAAAKL